MKVDNSYSSVKRRYYAALNLINKPEEQNNEDFTPHHSEPNYNSYKFQAGSNLKQKRNSTEKYYDIPAPTCPIPVPTNQKDDDFDEDRFIPPHLLVQRNDPFAPTKKRKNFNF